MAIETTNVCYTSPISWVTILGHKFRYIDCSYSGSISADIEIDDVSVHFDTIPKTISFNWGSVVLNDCVTCILGYRGVNITVNVTPANPPVVNYKGMSYHNWASCGEFDSCNLTDADISGKYVCISVNATTYESGTYRITVTYNFKGVTGSGYIDVTIGAITDWYGLRFNELYTVGTYSVTDATIQKI